MMTPLPAASPSALMTTGIEKAFEHRERFVGAGATDIGRGRDASARAEILGEAFRSFEARCSRAGAEGRDSQRAQTVSEPRDERRLGADNDEIDSVRLYERDQPVEIVGGNGHTFGVRLDPGIARCGIELGAAWRLCQLPAERMFAAPRSDQQDIHVCPFSRPGVRR